MFGAPGSGKGTQAKLLRDAIGLAHISTGDMLRERIQSGDELGKQVESILAQGQLVSDQIVQRLVEDRIELEDARKGFILDGFPRTVNQAKALGQLLATKGIATLVVHLKVDYNIIIARLSHRRLCPTCGTLYSVTPGASAQEACDYDGSKLVVRDDDREDVVRARLIAYENQTAPVLEWFKTNGYALSEVEGAGESPQAISRKVQAQIVEFRASVVNAKV